MKKILVIVVIVILIIFGIGLYVKSHDNSVLGYLTSASKDIDNGNYDQATTALKAAQANEKDAKYDSTIYSMFAQIDIKQGNLQNALVDGTKAIDAAEKISDTNSNIAKLYYARAIVNYNLKNTSDALADLNKAISLDTATPAYYVKRGVLKFELNKIPDGCNDIRPYLSQVDSSVTSQYQANCK